ncbi:MAG: hypothetical protein Kow0099_33440 [Candidatus Abyssubacteria bacterium]
MRTIIWPAWEHNHTLIFESIRAKAYLLAFFIVAGTYCVLTSWVDPTFPITFPDFGLELYISERTYSGVTPYLGFWQIWAPAAYYVGALAFKLFGVSILSARVLYAIVNVVSAALLFLASRRIAPKPLAFAVAVVFLIWSSVNANIPYSGWFAICSGMGAMLALIKAHETPANRHLWTIAAGVLLGLTFAFKQQIGGLTSLAAAVVLATGVYMTASRSTRPKAESAPLFRHLAAVLFLGILAPGYLALPALLSEQVHAAGLSLDIRYFAVFIVPLLMVNTFALWLIIRSLARNDASDYRMLIRRMVAGETALAGGFAATVAPWFLYFSHKMGWREFYTFITVSDPILSDFKRAYLHAGRLSPLNAADALLLVVTCLVGVTVAVLSVAGASRKKLLLAAAAAFGLLAGVFACFWTAGISPVLLLHASPVLVAVLLLTLGLRSKTGFDEPANSNERFVVLSLTLFSVYSSFSLFIYSDIGHYSMVVLPWLALIGWLLHVLFRRCAGLMVNPGFSSRLRRAGVFLGISLPFLIVYVGIPAASFYRSYGWNVNSVRRCSFETDMTGPLFAKLEMERGGIYINRCFREQMEAVVSHIMSTTAEDDYVFGAPSTTMFNFLTGRRYPSRHCYYLFDFLPKQEERELCRELEEKQPKYFIYDTIKPHSKTMRFRAGIFFRNYPLLDEYISRNYEFQERFGRFYLFTRTHRKNADLFKDPGRFPAHNPS